MLDIEHCLSKIKMNDVTAGHMQVLLREIKSSVLPKTLVEDFAHVLNVVSRLSPVTEFPIGTLKISESHNWLEAMNLWDEEQKIGERHFFFELTCCKPESEPYLRGFVCPNAAASRFNEIYGNMTSIHARGAFTLLVFTDNTFNFRVLSLSEYRALTDEGEK